MATLKKRSVKERELEAHLIWCETRATLLRHDSEKLVKELAELSALVQALLDQKKVRR